VTVDIPFAFDTDGILQWTAASMSCDALSSVTDKSFTKIANSSHHGHSRRECAVLDQAITRLAHAFLLATLSTNWKSLNRSTEVAEGSRLLLSLALITLHRDIA
jgi:hypothetical protein